MPSGNKLSTRAAGFGIVRFNTKTRDITMECWPRNVDITSPSAKQYTGWPKTISQFDNYSPLSWEVSGNLTFDVNNPVIQLIDNESNEILYTLRIKGKNYALKLPKGKSFTLKAGVDAPNKIISKSVSIGGSDQTITLK